MGVLPLEFIKGENAEQLGITGYERLNITGIEKLAPNKKLKVEMIREDGSTSEFQVVARLDSNVELEYYLHGGILNMILRNFLTSS